MSRQKNALPCLVAAEQSWPAATAARLCGGRLRRWPHERVEGLGSRTAWNQSCAATAAARLCSSRLQREPHERAQVLASLQHTCTLSTTERFHGSAIYYTLECYVTRRRQLQMQV